MKIYNNGVIDGLHQWTDVRCCGVQCWACSEIEYRVFVWAPAIIHVLRPSPPPNLAAACAYSERCPGVVRGAWQNRLAQATESDSHSFSFVRTSPRCKCLRRRDHFLLVISSAVGSRTFRTLDYSYTGLFVTIDDSYRGLFVTSWTIRTIYHFLAVISSAIRIFGTRVTVTIFPVNDTNAEIPAAAFYCRGTNGFIPLALYERIIRGGGGLEGGWPLTSLSSLSCLFWRLLIRKSKLYTHPNRSFSRHTFSVSRHNLVVNIRRWYR